MNFNSLFTKSIRTRSQIINYQTVRWRRPKKPFWLGIAKSKMFVIPQPKENPTPEERTTFARLTREYNTEYKSLVNFIRNENPNLDQKVSADGKNMKMSAALEKRISESLKSNEAWNAESGRRREERLKKSMEEEMEKAIKEIDVHEEIRMKQMEFIEEIVRKEKTLSASYITPENLEEAVENCLNTIDCYDFAIDLEGNRYPGRDSLSTSAKKPVEKEVSAQNVS